MRRIIGVLGSPSVSPRLLSWAIQLTIFILCGLAAFLLRFEFRLTPATLVDLAYALPIWVIAKALVFRALDLDRGNWLYASVPDLLRVGAGNLAGSAVATLAIWLIGPADFPRSVWVLDLLLCAQATASVRLLARVFRTIVTRAESSRKRQNVLIYGAGTGGVMLLQEIRQNPRLPYDVRAFVDDHPLKAGTRVQTVRVYHSDDLRALAERESVQQVLVAIPSATGAHMTGILERCHEAGLRCKTVPGLGDLMEGPGLAKQMRDVAVEDLLGRKPVRLDETAIRSKIEGAVVMVTGAAGSIGAELCRQIARFQPAAIVGFDAAETPLFHLQQEMRERFPSIPFQPEIGSIQNKLRLADVCQYYRPSILFHAAAYKHVPMMESALFAAVENNILGTRDVAAAAIEYGIADFVMISSDKAVRPTNIMGLTKRVAELIINSMQDTTKFVSVRFGNVLGSNGSVIPIFKSQIAAGGPVMVTHPEMRRFFMTIPEAVQLVLQASTMGRGGEIFVLEMGEPVKIVDLARNLILLSGLRPETDISISFSGIRPGEKLFEELSTAGESTVPTYHEKIKIFSGPGISRAEMDRHVQVIRQCCLARDTRRLIMHLKQLVPEYNPSTQVLEQLLAAVPLEPGPLYKHPIQNLALATGRVPAGSTQEAS
jgi:FlaA1/EpsC-like NDP-sugar epimerase